MANINNVAVPQNQVNNQNLLFNNKQDPKVVSEDAAMDLVLMLNNIIDDRITKRLSQNDIVKVFDAQITAVSNQENVQISTITVNNVEYPITVTKTITVSVEYDDYVYEDILNCTGELLTVGQWIKVCTYDNVKYYALHLS